MIRKERGNVIHICGVAPEDAFDDLAIWKFDEVWLAGLFHKNHFIAVA